ncbi:hypothetical protein NOF04DRAFT_1015724 [Fusarium oxysporum II5]|nr:hypothetical protein NOF04DRAFT_1015724 [Fusarium oxysporum II5]
MFWSMRPSLCTVLGITWGVFLLLDRCSHPREGLLLHCYLWHIMGGSAAIKIYPVLFLGWLVVRGQDVWMRK